MGNIVKKSADDLRKEIISLMEANETSGVIIISKTFNSQVIWWTGISEGGALDFVHAAKGAIKAKLEEREQKTPPPDAGEKGRGL